MNFHLKIWRQRDAASPGRIEDHEAADIPASASFLEMLDIVNEGIVTRAATNPSPTTAIAARASAGRAR